MDGCRYATPRTHSSPRDLNHNQPSHSLKSTKSRHTRTDVFYLRCLALIATTCGGAYRPKKKTSISNNTRIIGYTLSPTDPSISISISIPPHHQYARTVIYNATHTPPLRIPTAWGLVFLTVNGVCVEFLGYTPSIPFFFVRAWAWCASLPITYITYILTHPPIPPIHTFLKKKGTMILSLLFEEGEIHFSKEELDLFEEHFLPYGSVSVSLSSIYMEGRNIDLSPLSPLYGIWSIDVIPNRGVKARKLHV